MSTIKVDTIATRTGSGNITASNTIDLNGNELILDVDGDTSLTADTDDQIDIRIGGTDVGTLTQDSGKLTINSTGTNLAFAVGGTVELNTDGTQFYPGTDDSHNLGTSSLRFNNLYLSGGVFIGGTGPGNKLEDYEEGTWTPTLPNGGTVVSNYKSVYIKVGELVYFYTYGVFTPTNDNADFRIGGLPFAPVSNNHGIGSIGYSHVVDTHYWSSPLVHPSSYMYFHRIDGNSDTIKNNAFGGNQRNFIVGGVYTLT